MSSPKPKVIIGPISDDPAESVSGVNKSFIEGLADDYHFIEQRNDRRLGATSQSQLNPINSFYFSQQLAQWTLKLAIHRPQIAHYALNAGWAMEKSLLFLDIARFFGIKTLAHLHSGSFLDFWKSIPKSRAKRAFRKLTQLHGLVVLSESWKQNFHREIGFPLKNIWVVNNPIDQSFEKAALSMAVERRENLILAIGILSRHKGILDLIEAVRIASPLGNTKVLIAGPEREPGILQAVNGLIEQHSLTETIKILPSVWGDSKIELFRSASVFILPSYYENFPLVILEAAAAGQAIITTPVGAVPEFFQDNVSAIFVQPGNVLQISEALKKMHFSHDDCLRFGTSARNVFLSRLQRSKIMFELSKVYNSLLND